MVIWLVFWFVVLVVFSLGGHTDTYRVVVKTHGAFELCLSCLGIVYQKQLLGLSIWFNAGRIRSEWGEDRRTLTVQALHFVWEQLIHGLTDPYGFWCLVYVFGVDVYVEHSEDRQHYVGHYQPTDHEPEDGVDALRCPVDGDHVGVSHDYLFRSVFRRYWA